MTPDKPKKSLIAIVAVIAVSVALGALILGSKKSAPGGGHAEAPEGGSQPPAGHAEGKEDKSAKGPHGGRLFTDGDYGVEVAMSEDGGQPRFRLYTYLKGKPLDPAQTAAQLTLERLGRAAQVLRFKPEGDYLLGDAVVGEPHSFKVTVTAARQGKNSTFAYEQIEGRLTMSDAQLQQSGVEIALAGPTRIAIELQLIGEVRYNVDRTVQMVPRLAGRVESVAVAAGDRVRAGQVLAVISSQALADQRNELLLAQRRLSLARSTFEREKKLWEEKISAEQDYLQARSAMQEAELAVQGAQQKLAALGGPAGSSGTLTRFEIRSPIDGVVTDKRISLGEVLKEDAPIFTVSDLSTVWVEVTVAAKDLGAIAIGQKATVKATAFEAQADSKIAYISALVGEQTRSATARIVLPNPKGIWRPGLPVTVAVTVEEAQVPVAVSLEALQTLGDSKVVFGRYGNALEARPLELGRADGRNVEVKQGLNAGERYVAKNSFLMKAELGKGGVTDSH